MARHRPPSQDPAQRERDDADGPVDESDLGGGEREPALRPRIEQERRHHLDELRFAQAVEQQERQQHADARLAEERAERGQEFANEMRDLPCLSRAVRRRPRQHPAVPQPESQERHRQHAHRRRPRDAGAARAGLDRAGEHHEEPLPRDRGDAIEHAADPDEERLLPLRGGQHVEAVGRDVVGGGVEREEPEERHAPLDEMRSRDRERHAGEPTADQELRPPDPAAARAQQVHDRRPQRLNHPGQVEPARVERDVGVRETEALVHDDRHGYHDDIGQSLREVQRGNPGPRVPGRYRLAGHGGLRLDRAGFDSEVVWPGRSGNERHSGRRPRPRRTATGASKTSMVKTPSKRRFGGAFAESRPAGRPGTSATASS